MRLVTSSGGIVPLLTQDFNPDIKDIAKALSYLPLYGGHAGPYSYAQHSVILSHLCDPSQALQALLHDAHVPYSGALTEQQRESADSAVNGQWVVYELQFARRVRSWFGLKVTLPSNVARAHEKLTEHEIGHLFDRKTHLSWGQVGVKPRCGPLDGPWRFIEPWSADEARREFIKRFTQVGQA